MFCTLQALASSAPTGHYEHVGLGVDCAAGVKFDPQWRRVAVLGAWGSGKTTLANRLGELTSIPVVHLDQLWWKEGYTPSEPAEWIVKHSAAIAHQEWIIDGNIIGPGGLDDRLERAHVAVLLALPRRVSTWRFVKRAARVGVKPGPDALNWTEVRGAWEWPTKKLPQLRAVLDRHASHLPVVVLSSRSDVERFVASASAVGC